MEGENQAAQEKGEEPTDTQEESKDQPKEEQEETDRSQSQAVSGNEKSAPAVAEPQVEITREQLEDYDYLLGNFFIVDSTTAVDETRINAPGLLDMDMTLEKDPSVPQILIYHTHSQEGFADSREGVQEDTVVGVGDYLTELLQDQYGYGVIHDTGTYDVVVQPPDTAPCKDGDVHSPGRLLDHQDRPLMILIRIRQIPDQKGVRPIVAVIAAQSHHIVAEILPALIQDNGLPVSAPKTWDQLFIFHICHSSLSILKSLYRICKIDPVFIKSLSNNRPPDSLLMKAS